MDFMLLFLGIITVILSLGLGYFSWQAMKKGNFKLAVFLLIVFGLILRIYVGSDLYLHCWDERYHALVAKNLMNHPFFPTLYENPILGYDIENWTGNHIWVHTQPLPLWGFSLS